MQNTLYVMLLLTVATRAADYGKDCSFPIHQTDLTCGNTLGDRKTFYEDFMDGCRQHYRGHLCDANEQDRLAMSRRQPQSMVNYTATGFLKRRAPTIAMDILNTHWWSNKAGLFQRPEIWPKGNIYTNHWAAPTYMASVEDTRLRGGGQALKDKIWDAVKDVIEDWTGMEQKPISLYGIRAYTNGAVLSPHVDRLPLVSSCIINVDQDVEEDWPLEVYDRHDRAVNVTMQPGDMVLYESGSLIHGRPFPLKGRFYANIFIHFEPTVRKLLDKSSTAPQDGLPPYLVRGSPEISNWKEQNPGGWRHGPVNAPAVQETTPEAHRAAARGDVERLKVLAKAHKPDLHAKDHNGWQPLHEAVRADRKEVVELLLKQGADMNARVGKDGKGGSALNLAMQYLHQGAATTKYLRDLGAVDIEADEL